MLLYAFFYSAHQTVMERCICTRRKYENFKRRLFLLVCVISDLSILEGGKLCDEMLTILRHVAEAVIKGNSVLCIQKTRSF